MDVSVLILTYNRFELSSKYIPKALERLGDIQCEVLIWDNHSEDGTLDWLLEYGRSDPRITNVFAGDTNIGMEAINNLADIAKGKYLLKLDDDAVPPHKFAERLVAAYEQVNEDKLLFLGWDMPWTNGTFATRSGMKLYKGDRGKIVKLGMQERVLIHYTPSKWMVNGVCRLSRRDKFLEIGGHPKGVIYGVDYLVSAAAEKHGYWIGFFDAKDYVVHKGGKDPIKYRTFKNRQLKKHGAPRDV